MRTIEIINKILKLPEFYKPQIFSLAPSFLYLETSVGTFKIDFWKELRVDKSDGFFLSSDKDCDRLLEEFSKN